MGETLKRTGFSPNIKERLDYSCAVYDSLGRTIAQGDHMPVHLGAMPLSVQAAIAHGPMQPGDMVALNDPFRGGTHLPDITLVCPVFADQSTRPLFYVANRAHHSDVGGMSPGSMPLASEIFQEGLIIPPVKLIRAGEISTDILSLLLANVRTPVEREGDLTAQIAANRVGTRRLQELLAKHGIGLVTEYAAAVQDYSERVMRATIDAIPDGEYRFEDSLDNDGFGSGRISIRVAIRITKGEAVVDFSGTDEQTRGGINANFAITMSATLYAFRCLINDEVLYNDGISRPIQILAPPGSVVNASHPAAVAGGNVETSQRITDVVLGALAQALPEVIPAASQGTMNNITLGGVNSRTGRPFAYYETLGGGMGAGPRADGLSGVHTHMSNTRNTPIESIEHDLPIRIRQYRLRTGSGGRGRFQGGQGIVREYEMLDSVTVTILSDRREKPPYGMRGGQSGQPGRNTLITADGQEGIVPSKTRLELNRGDRLRIETPGGGGFGS